MRSLPFPRTTTFDVRRHVVTLECVDRTSWRVSVDGQRLASFSSEARARIAGRREARRLAFIAADPHRRAVPPVGRS